MAGRRTPQVVAGPRQPTDRRGVEPEQEVKDIAAARAALHVPKAEGEVVYQGIAARLRIQLTAPRDRIDPVSGSITRFRGKVAQFEDFEFRTRDEEIIEILDNHRNYGLRRNFWRAEEGRAEALEGAVASLVNTVKNVADPETARRLIAELAPLAGADFQLPVAVPDNKPADAVPAE